MLREQPMNERKQSRVAALYDIHGNLPALGAVLKDVESANVDLVGNALSDLPEQIRSTPFYARATAAA